MVFIRGWWELEKVVFIRGWWELEQVVFIRGLGIRTGGVH